MYNHVYGPFWIVLFIFTISALYFIRPKHYKLKKDYKNMVRKQQRFRDNIYT